MMVTFKPDTDHALVADEKDIKHARQLFNWSLVHVGCSSPAISSPSSTTIPANIFRHTYPATYVDTYFSSSPITSS